ncbi:MAG: class IIb bacteriocin, lactobin A/cerein 7B family [Streptococcaceae bacterium]|jgi:lactobin A/cerein 7B family class IIb bacteriocin|nr:class IIb bacteriocin, lactobin A/cerein 7B family [Streptococcaceae bacterium]
MMNEKMMALDFVELTDEELQEVNGGFWPAIGATVLAGVIMDGFKHSDQIIKGWNSVK